MNIWFQAAAAAGLQQGYPVCSSASSYTAASEILNRYRLEQTIKQLHGHGFQDPRSLGIPFSGSNQQVWRKQRISTISWSGLELERISTIPCWVFFLYFLFFVGSGLKSKISNVVFFYWNEITMIFQLMLLFVHSEEEFYYIYHILKSKKSFLSFEKNTL